MNFYNAIGAAVLRTRVLAGERVRVDELAQLVQERDYVGGNPRTPRPQAAFDAMQNAILTHGTQMNLDNAADDLLADALDEN